MFVTETYDIEDCIRYDDAQTDKHLDYSTFLANPNNAYVSWNSDYKEYKINYSRTPESNPVILQLDEVTLSDFEISVDIWYTASTTKQWTFRLVENSSDIWTNHSECGTWSSSKIFRNTVNGTNSQSNPSGAMPTSAWIRCKFVKQNGTLTISATNLSTSSSIGTYSSSAWSITNILPVIYLSEYINSFVFKRLKIKAL